MSSVGIGRAVNGTSSSGVGDNDSDWEIDVVGLWNPAEASLEATST